MSGRAVILSGSLGLGHDVTTELLATSLADLGWESTTLDCMRLLGGIESRVADRIFRRLTATASVYDSLHFSQIRPGTGVALAMDRAATKRLVPAVRAAIGDRPADLLIATFPTGASTAAKLADRTSGLRTVVLCTDALVHRFWAWPEIDRFLVTSEAAAASVRRYAPRAGISVVPTPVRPAFYHPSSQAEARRGLGVPLDEPCVLVMGGGWGLGPLDGATEALGRQGVHVLAVAGYNVRLHQRLTRIVGVSRFVRAFGFTDRVPELMAAADLVVTTPGATTCGEARVVGRRLVLLDVFPGHGRENVQRELELGGADVCGGDPSGVTGSVLAALTRLERPLPVPDRSPAEWQDALAAALLELDESQAGSPGTPIAR